MENIKLLDCTFRDGGFYSNWNFNLDLVERYFEVINSSKISYSEVGFRLLDASRQKGPFAYCDENFLNSLKIPEDLNLSIMIKASDFIKNEKFIRANLDYLIPVPKIKSKVKLIRISSPICLLNNLFEITKILKTKGYMVGINITKISTYSKDNIFLAGSIVKKMPIDVLYFADTFGSLSSRKVVSLISYLKESWGGEVGFHAHDNKGKAFQNSICAIKSGASWIDSSILGMGRGAGNAKTEKIILETNKKESIQNFSESYLDMLIKDFLLMKEKYAWGPNKYYFLAADNNIHPSYIQEYFAQPSFDEVEILSMIEYLKKIDSTVFTKENFKIANQKSNRSFN